MCGVGGVDLLIILLLMWAIFVLAILFILLAYFTVKFLVKIYNKKIS